MKADLLVWWVCINCSILRPPSPPPSAVLFPPLSPPDWQRLTVELKAQCVWWIDLECLCDMYYCFCLSHMSCPLIVVLCNASRGLLVRIDIKPMELSRPNFHGYIFSNTIHISMTGTESQANRSTRVVSWLWWMSLYYAQLFLLSKTIVYSYIFVPHIGCHGYGWRPRCV